MKQLVYQGTYIWHIWLSDNKVPAFYGTLELEWKEIDFE